MTSLLRKPCSTNHCRAFDSSDMYNAYGIAVDWDEERLYVSVGSDPGSDPVNPPTSATGSVRVFDPTYKVIDRVCLICGPHFVFRRPNRT